MNSEYLKQEELNYSYYPLITMSIIILILQLKDTENLLGIRHIPEVCCLQENNLSAKKQTE